MNNYYTAKQTGKQLPSRPPEQRCDFIPLKIEWPIAAFLHSCRPEWPLTSTGGCNHEMLNTKQIAMENRSTFSKEIPEPSTSKSKTMPLLPPKAREKKSDFFNICTSGSFHLYHLCNGMCKEQSSILHKVESTMASNPRSCNTWMHKESRKLFLITVLLYPNLLYPLSH